MRNARCTRKQDAMQFSLRFLIFASVSGVNCFYYFLYLFPYLIILKIGYHNLSIIFIYNLYYVILFIIHCMLLNRGMESAARKSPLGFCYRYLSLSRFLSLTRVTIVKGFLLLHSLWIFNIYIGILCDHIYKFFVFITVEVKNKSGIKWEYSLQ